MGYILDLRRKLGSRPLIMAGAGVIIINDKNEILLGKRTDNGYWDYPAGSMELGESFAKLLTLFGIFNVQEGKYLRKPD